MRVGPPVTCDAYCVTQRPSRHPLRPFDKLRATPPRRRPAPSPPAEDTTLLRRRGKGLLPAAGVSTHPGLRPPLPGGEAPPPIPSQEGCRVSGGVGSLRWFLGLRIARPVTEKRTRAHEGHRCDRSLRRQRRNTVRPVSALTGSVRKVSPAARCPCGQNWQEISAKKGQKGRHTLTGGDSPVPRGDGGGSGGDYAPSARPHSTVVITKFC